MIDLSICSIRNIPKPKSHEGPNVKWRGLYDYFLALLHRCNLITRFQNIENQSSQDKLYQIIARLDVVLSIRPKSLQSYDDSIFYHTLTSGAFVKIKSFNDIQTAYDRVKALESMKISKSIDLPTISALLNQCSSYTRVYRSFFDNDEDYILFQSYNEEDFKAVAKLSSRVYEYNELSKICSSILRLIKSKHSTSYM